MNKTSQLYRPLAPIKTTELYRPFTPIKTTELHRPLTSIKKPILNTVATDKITKLTQNNSKCDPIYKTLEDGSKDYSMIIGCEERPQGLLQAYGKKDNKELILKGKSNNQLNETAAIIPEVQSTAKPMLQVTGTNKLIYRGKNLEMTQGISGNELITVKGPNKTIEIEYPPQDDIHGFITLKQGSRLYKIPYKNRTESKKTPDVLSGKSDVAYTPDYLRTSMTDTETFKVRDTSITKKTYANGAKVITMEKDKASLSIYYPPKNGTKKYNDSGYMTLKEMVKHIIFHLMEISQQNNKIQSISQK